MGEAISAQEIEKLEECILLTVTETAQTLKLSKLTIYALIKSGQLKAFKLGGRQYRIFEADLMDFVKKGDLVK